MKEVISVPVFPLPTVVLYPHVSIPLHIFEPRYLKMVEDALAGDTMIAMASFHPGWEKEYDGNPPIREIVCVGTISSYNRLEDGRYIIALKGKYRGKIASEDFSLPYRKASVEIMEDFIHPAEMDLAIRKAEETMKLWSAAVAGGFSSELEISSEPPRSVTDVVAISYKIADGLKVAHNLKVQLLEMDSVLERLETERAALENIVDILKLTPRRAEPLFYGFSSN